MGTINWQGQFFFECFFFNKNKRRGNSINKLGQHKSDTFKVKYFMCDGREVCLDVLVGTLILG